MTEEAEKHYGEVCYPDPTGGMCADRIAGGQGYGGETRACTPRQPLAHHSPGIRSPHADPVLPERRL
jgi:hypothetical protein